MNNADKTSRRKYSENKIEKFHITDDMIEDPAMDEFLRKSFMEEADEFEREINSDPELMGVGASDDLFLKIKAQLQEEGVWEEDEAEENKAEENKTGENKVEEIDGNKINGIRENRADEIYEIEKNEDNGQKQDREDVYSFLSEEDREALEIGRKVRKRKSRRVKYWKQLVAAGLVIVILAGVGMSGDASRNWLLDALNRFETAVGFRITMDYQEDQENMKLKEEEEKAAWNNIKQRLNISAVDFVYKPTGFVFNDYKIDDKANEVIFFYSYKETIFFVQIEYGNKNYTKAFTSDVEPILQESFINDQKLEIEIWNTSTDETESYTANFKANDIEYFFVGNISFREIKKMMTLIHLF